MKNYFTVILLLLVVSCSSDNHFEINGTFKGDIEDQWIYLSKFMAVDPNTDSIFMQNGMFQFSGNCGYPESFMIQNHRDSALAWFHFYLEPGKIILDIDPKDWAYGSSVLGGKINDEYNTNIRYPREEFIQFRNETLEKMATADSLQLKELEKIMKSVNDSLMQEQIGYVENNPDSPISPFLLGQNFFMIPIEEVEILISSFSDENKNTSIIISLQEKLEMLKKYSNSPLEIE